MKIIIISKAMDTSMTKILGKAYFSENFCFPPDYGKMLLPCLIFLFSRNCNMKASLLSKELKIFSCSSSSQGSKVYGFIV